MRGAIFGILAGAALAFGSTAANASLTVLACDPSIDNGCTQDNTLAPAQSTISWSDSNVGASPFTGVIDFNNTLGGNYYVSLTTASPNVLFTTLTIYQLVSGVPTGSPVLQYLGAPTGNIFMLPGSFGAGDYRLTFGGTTSGGGGEGGTLSFFSAVPEPATWGLMLLGFGAIGVAMRRSRRRDNRVLMQVA
jgi:PEP-CTERM motif